MKSQVFTPIKTTKLSNFPLILALLLMLTLTLVLPNVRAQQAKLSLADILVALRSTKVTLVERNEILSAAIKERGITFELTPQIEKELENTGADKALIDAVKQQNLLTKPVEKPEPKPTPVATPVPTPKPVEPDSAFYKKQADENVFKGDLDSALTNYGKAIELNPKNSSAFLNRASTFFKKKDFEKAIADYSSVIDLNPKEIIAYSSRANAFEKLGNVEKAVEDYKKILEIDDKNEAAVNNLKRIEDERARAIQQQKDQEAALAQAQISEESNSKNNQKPENSVVLDSAQLFDLGRLSPQNAVEMVSPVYSQIAKTMNLQGQVTVQIMLDEEGKVISADATEGHKILRESAEQAARKSKFKPAMVDGKPVKSKGYIIYNFVR